MVQLKRIYDPYSSSDGYRILVDRLWPRGIKKEAAKIDSWQKTVAPSPELRKWFNHEPAKWEAFCKAYKKELTHTSALDTLIETLAKEKKVTLLYAAKDKKHNHALVLYDLINQHEKK